MTAAAPRGPARGSCGPPTAGSATSARPKLNGWLGLTIAGGDGHRAALAAVVSDGSITRIDAVRNPEKLRRLRAR
jgi:RNA polymerase sigma-70 factor, ECF subfamily